MTDLERPSGHYFQHTITMRLNDLELQESELSLAIKQLRADIENLKVLAEGPITDQVEHAIERDPVMIALAQQLALLEGQLSGRLTKFGRTPGGSSDPGADRRDRAETRSAAPGDAEQPAAKTSTTP
jgi:hypothetical protein